ncbi:MAG: hypothetical protein FJX35_16705 [Alphaproteobacteria bacterium]|nr:hypothetical protein [Alphaproteobacteria bacterium]
MSWRWISVAADPYDVRQTIAEEHMRPIIHLAATTLIALPMMAMAAAESPPAHTHVPDRHAQPHAGPYAGQDSRPIKALTDRQIDELRTGRGMGLALAAELNHYPGPAHVLELAADLELTPHQKARVEALWRAMTAEACAVGDRIIAREAELDGKFAAGTIAEAELAAATGEIGRLNGELRFVHLKYHLAVKSLLRSEQVARYSVLRGYGQPPATGPAHRH